LLENNVDANLHCWTRPVALRLPLTRLERLDGADALKIRPYVVRAVLAAVVPLGVLAAVFVYRLIDNERHAYQQAMTDVVRAMSVALDSEIQHSITALEVLALSDEIDSGNLDEFRTKAEVARARHGRWSNLVLARADGTRLLNLRVPNGNLVPSGKDDSPLQAAVLRRPVISDASTSVTSGKTTTFITVPVLRGDGAPYVLSASIEFDVWTDWLARQVPPGALAAAIDDKAGVILARSARPEDFVGKRASEQLRAAYAQQRTGLIRTQNLEGLVIYAAYDTSEATGWHTLLLTPASAVEAGATRFAVGLAVTTVLVLLVSILLALRMARPLAGGITQLGAAIGRVGRGEPPAWRCSGIDEIDAAGQAAGQASALLAARAQDVQTLQAQLAQRAEAAERANQSKDQFLGMLGHELRNPLSAVSNATAVLRLQADDTNRRMLDIIDRQTRQLTALVDDLLDVSRAVAGKLHVQPSAIELGSVVERQMEALKAAGALAAHEVSLRCAEAPVLVDPERMAQVVRNLVENSIKYTPPGGRIDVQVAVHGGHAVLTVTDNGKGISSDLLPHVFEPFTQAPQSIDRSAGGLGLGLSIVKQIVELHGGAVHAYSAGTGQGAQFAVELPLRTVQAVAATPALQSTPSRPLRVALVDDHDDARAGLRSLLQSEGHEVHEAADGPAGLALIGSGNFDVALIDIGLPGFSGLELARRAREAGAGCRLVAVTGYGQLTDRARAEAAGFDAFLIKPATGEQIRRALAPDCETAR
jgi:signal transduction histidine kinase